MSKDEKPIKDEKPAKDKKGTLIIHWVHHPVAKVFHNRGRPSDALLKQVAEGRSGCFIVSAADGIHSFSIATISGLSWYPNRKMA